MRYYIGDRTEDDFGQPILRLKGEKLYDAKTVHHGVWALMTEQSFKYHGLGRLGTGAGQEYEHDGEHYVKVRG